MTLWVVEISILPLNSPKMGGGSAPKFSTFGREFSDRLTLEVGGFAACS